MPDLHFEVAGARAVPHSASPLLGLRLTVTNRAAREPVRAAMLQCQVRLEPQARSYSEREQEALRDLFGPPAQWGTSVRSLLWTNAQAVLQPFESATEVELQLPCSYDFNAGASKFFYALESGEVPLRLLFSGTVFYEAAGGALQVSPVPWSREATFRLPILAWRTVMEQHHPGRVYVSLERDTFDRLFRYRAAQGLPTWEQALARLLDGGAP